MCANVTKVGQGHPKLLLVQRLDWTYQAAKYDMCYTLCLKKVPTFKLSVTLSNLDRF